MYTIALVYSTNGTFACWYKHATQTANNQDRCHHGNQTVPDQYGALLADHKFLPLGASHECNVLLYAPWQETTIALTNMPHGPHGPSDKLEQYVAEGHGSSHGPTVRPSNNTPTTHRHRCHAQVLMQTIMTHNAWFMAPTTSPCQWYSHAVGWGTSLQGPLHLISNATRGTLDPIGHS